MKRSLLICLLLISGSALASTKTLNDGLAILKKKHEVFGGIVVDKLVDRKGVAKSFLNLKFSNDNVLYELDVKYPVLEKDYEIEKKNLSGIISKSYQDQPTPYVGEVTNLAKCPARFNPKFTEKKLANQKIYIIESLVGKDLSYGLCEDKLVSKLACTAFYYDTEKAQYFKLKAFTGLKESCEKIIVSFLSQMKNL